jgi:hypothetical protein
MAMRQRFKRRLNALGLYVLRNFWRRRVSPAPSVYLTVLSDRRGSRSVFTIWTLAMTRTHWRKLRSSFAIV